MNGVNLIPVSRRRVRARRAQIRVWATVLAVCVVAFGGTYAGLRSMWESGDDPAADVQKLSRDIETAQRLDKIEQTRVVEARAAAEAAREVLDQPDWGVLLAFVADRLGPEAALDSFRLEPPSRAASQTATAKDSASKPGGQTRSPRAGGYTLVLTGVARTQDAASGVAIDLKRSDVFASVTLVETRRAGFMGEPAVGFRIDCAIVGAGGVE